MDWFRAGRYYHGAFYDWPQFDRFSGSNEPDDPACDVCEKTEADGATLSVWYSRGSTDAMICDDCRASDPANETDGAA